MKKILILCLGLLLFGADLYAAGDLIVNGRLGAGTSSPASRLHVYSVNESMALRLNANLSAPTSYTSIGAYYSVVASGTGINSTRYLGFQGETNLTGYGNVQEMIGAENIVTFNASGSGSTIAGAKGNTVILRRGSLNTQNHSLTTYYGFHSYGQASTGSGNLSGTDWRHAYFEDLPYYGGTLTNMAGLWIDKQTRGTNNYGIVLNGDGVGADIVFGTTQQAKIYSNTGELFAKDAAGNITQISPHDPVTGEWVFYSKNVKTGRVVKVEMEKLVKAVEKLTGESFMVETLIEGK
jgi:hypothetical protein